MRYYSKRRPQNIIIPIYPAAVFAGDQIQKLGDIKYVYYIANNLYTQATGVYAESSEGTITAQPGQGILTISMENESLYTLTFNYNSAIAQTIEVVQGNYYFVIPNSSAFVALEDGTIVATLFDSAPTSSIAATAASVLFRSMYGLNLQLE